MTVSSLKTGLRVNLLSGTSFSPLAPAGVAGYVGGGDTSGSGRSATVDKFAFASDARSTLATGLSSARWGPSGFENKAVAGYAAGGNDGSGSTAVDKFAFPSDARSTLGTGLSSGNEYGAGVSNLSTAGYAALGNLPGSGLTTTVDKFAFPSDSRTTLGTGLSTAREAICGFEDTEVAGYFAGGDTSGSGAYVNTVDKFDFSDDTRTTLATGLSSSRGWPTGFSNPTVAGYAAGGFTGSPASTVDKFAFPGDSRSTLATGLSISVYGAAGFQDA